MIRILIITATAALLVGCSTSAVVPAGPDTYTISAQGAGFCTGGVRANTYNKANEFCQKRGLVMVPVSFDSQGGKLGERPPTAELVFRALPPGDPEIKRPNVEGPNHIQRIQVR